MSTDILALYHARFGRLPGSKELMSFSRQCEMEAKHRRHDIEHRRGHSSMVRHRQSRAPQSKSKSSSKSKSRSSHVHQQQQTQPQIQSKTRRHRSEYASAPPTQQAQSIFVEDEYLTSAFPLRPPSISTQEEDTRDSHDTEIMETDMMLLSCLESNSKLCGDDKPDLATDTYHYEQSMTQPPPFEYAPDGSGDHDSDTDKVEHGVDHDVLDDNLTVNIIDTDDEDALCGASNEEEPTHIEDDDEECEDGDVSKTVSASLFEHLDSFASQTRTRGVAVDHDHDHDHGAEHGNHAEVPVAQRRATGTDEDDEEEFECSTKCSCDHHTHALLQREPIPLNMTTALPVDPMSQTRSGHSHSKYLRHSNASAARTHSSPQQSLSWARTPSIDNVCDDQLKRETYQSLQSKLMEMDEFARTYASLHSDCVRRTNSLDRQRALQFQRSRQCVVQHFGELYAVLKERENAFLYELDQTFASQQTASGARGHESPPQQAELQHALREYMSFLSQSLNASPARLRTTQMVHEMRTYVESQHASKMRYFDAQYSALSEQFASVQQQQQSGAQFVVDSDRYAECCQLLRGAGEIGVVLAQVPRLKIRRIQILGNDRLSLQLESHPQIDARASTTHEDGADLYRVVSYRISYGYRSTQTSDEQAPMQWESAQFEAASSSSSPTTGSDEVAPVVEFEIDDLNLVNADLMIKVQCLLRHRRIRRARPTCVSVWTDFSDCHRLTQKDLMKTVSFPCLDSRDFIYGMNGGLGKYDSVSTNHDHETVCTVSPLFTGTQRHSFMVVSGAAAAGGGAHEHAYEPTNTIKINESCTLDDDDDGDGDDDEQEDDEQEEDEQEEKDEEVTEHDDHGDGDDEHDDDEDEDEDDEDDDEAGAELYSVDMVEFAKHLCADQHALEHDLIHNQRLMQEFMRTIDATKEINAALRAELADTQNTQQLWTTNKNDIIAMRNKSTPKSNFRRTHAKNAASVSLSSEQQQLALASSSVPNDRRRHSKTSSITQNLARKLSKLSRKLSNMSIGNGNESRLSALMKHENDDDDNGGGEMVVCDDVDAAMDDAQVSLYGALVHLLQEHACYLAWMTGPVAEEHRSLWTRTIVCDLFGDECDSRGEHLLLRLFEQLLSQFEGDTSMDVCACLGDDDALLPQMIASFVFYRCGENRSILHGILGDVMTQLMSDDCQLETDPATVYQELLARGNCSDNDEDEATRTTTSANQIAVHAQVQDANVQKIVSCRVEHLRALVRRLLDGLVENAHKLSFGVRWICKRVARVADTGNNNDHEDAYAGVGLIIYRYLERVLNAPNGNNPDEVRRQCVLHNVDVVCQILRSVFCASETPMATSWTHWIQQQRREVLPLFYEKLLDVNATDLKDRLSADAHLAHCKKDLHLSVQQIYLLHHQLFASQDMFARKTPTRKIDVEMLDLLHELRTDAPSDFDDERYQHNVVQFDFTLILNNRKHENDEVEDDDEEEEEEEATNDDDDDDYYDNRNMGGKHDALQVQCNDHDLLHCDESYIYNVLFHLKFQDDAIMCIRQNLRALLTEHDIPQHMLLQCRHSLKRCLLAIRGWAQNHHATATATNEAVDIVALVDAIVEAMCKYQAQHSAYHGYNLFAYGYDLDMKKVFQFSRRLQCKTMSLAKARDAVVDFTQVLEDKLADYRQLLYSDVSTVCTKQIRPFKLSWKHMMQQHAIAITGDAAGDVEAQPIGFQFRYENEEHFSLTMKQKHKSKTRPKSKSRSKTFTYDLSLLSLLKLRQQKHTQFLLEPIAFDVDAMIDLLNGAIANSL